MQDFKVWLIEKPLLEYVKGGLANTSFALSS